MIFGEFRRWLNNLSRNTRGRAAGRKKARPARPGLEVLEGREVPAVVLIESVGGMGDTPTATNNDYTRVQQALDTANSGDTIQLRGTFDWTETNAKASWAKGNDGLVGTDDDYSILVRDNLNNVTLKADTLGAARILGPGDVASVNQEGFIVFWGRDNQNWTISNLEIFDFDVGIGMFARDGDAYQGTTITGNHIRVATDLNGVEAPADSGQNIGIHYSFGKNQTISDNVIEIPGTGVSDPSADLMSNRKAFSTTVGMQSNTSGGATYDGLRITGNEIRVLNSTAANRERIIGFWDNAHGHLSDIEVSNNKFLNLDSDNDSSLNLQQAFWITSHSGAATTVTYSGNHVEGASIGFKWMGDPEFPGQNFSPYQAVRLWGNTVVDSNTGVLIQSGGAANLFQNTITGSGAGGAVNVVNGRLTGVEQNDLSGGAGDAIVLGVNSSVTGGIFNNNLATNGLGIRNNGAGLVNAAGNWWGTSNGPTNLSSQIDYSPWLTTGTDTDPLTPGFQGDFSNLTVNATSPRHAGQTTGNLQEGIDQVTAGGTVNALAGTYLESVTVNKPVTVLGAQAGRNPAGRTNPALESIVSAPSGTNGFSIGADNVTVRGFTVTTAGGGVHGVAETTQVTGTVIDRNIVSGFGGLGISLAAGSNGAVVTENDVSDNYAGIYLSTGASNATVRANVVHDNTGTGPDAGSGIVLEGNNTGVLVSQNFIRDNAGSGIYVWDGYGNDFSGTKITSNSITGNDGGGFNNTNATVIDATGNWWGTSTAVGVAARISGNVDVMPFLVTGKDTSAAPGFQGDFSVAPGEGSVRVQVVGNRLMLTGDNRNNWISIEKGPTPNSYRVTGLYGTQINGRSGSFDFANVTRGIDANLQGGHDQLVLDGSASHLRVPGLIKVRTGSGADLVRLQGVTGKADIGSSSGNDSVQLVDSDFRTLSVDMGNGASTSLLMDDVTVTGQTDVRGGKGADTVRAVDSTFASLFIATGDGSDTVRLENVDASGRVRVGTARGNDLVAVSDSSFDAAVVLGSSFGDDYLDAGTLGGSDTKGNTFLGGIVFRGFEDVS